MPGYDRSGPMGRGPMTGGGFGYCGGGRVAGYGAGRGGFGAAGYGLGRGGAPWGGGRGRGFGGGRGRGRRWAYGPDYYGAPAPAMYDETEALKAAAEDLRMELKAVEERLRELEKDKE